MKIIIPLCQASEYHWLSSICLNRRCTTTVVDIGKVLNQIRSAWYHLSLHINDFAMD